MLKKERELSTYRYALAEETLIAAKTCIANGLYRDCINRSYYAVFYAVKAVIVLGGVDFKRHKDVVAYFNKEYVAGGIFPRELGKRLGRLQALRETSDYNDFYVASKEEASNQLETVEYAMRLIKVYLIDKDIFREGSS